MAGTLVSSGFRFDRLPENYIRPESERPRLSEIVSLKVPLIDLDSSNNRDEFISQIRDACSDFGFFQVTNHGISAESTQKVFEISREFFHLPVEEKMRYYSNDPSQKMRLGTSVNVMKEKVHSWRDYLRFYCYPLEEFVNDWPSTPQSFKDVVSNYSTEVRVLGFKLLGAISESLGLERDYIERVLGGASQHMVAGLQVLKDGEWVAVDPQPNSLVVNIGDQIQALSNGRYKSVWHRAIVNSSKERISVGSFLCPANDAVIASAKELTSEESPAIYRNFTYDEFCKLKVLEQEYGRWTLLRALQVGLQMV